MPKFYASIPGNWPLPPATIIIEAPSLEEASKLAKEKFVTANLIVQQTGDDAVADYTVES